METVVLAVLVVILLIASLAFVMAYRAYLSQKRENAALVVRLDTMEQKISTSVEERLVSHAKYCEQVDALVQTQLKIEEKKWRELLDESVALVSQEVREGHAEAAAKIDAANTEFAAAIEKSRMNFKALLDQAYLEEYEKMRKSPPKPKTGPRKKVAAPERYRSLDDDFAFEVKPLKELVPDAVEDKPAADPLPPKKKTATRKKR